MKYNKTKYSNIYTYETKKGKRYYVRRNFKLNGKKKEASASNLKTLAEARRALAEIENKIANNEYDSKKNMTVNDYWEIYSENRIKTGRWAPDTVVCKMNIYNRNFAKKYGNMKLKDIDRLEYEKYMTGLLKRLTRSSVRQINSVFEAMLNDAVVNGYLDKNPVFKIYIGESKNPPKNKRISLDEFREWDACARKLLSKYEYTMVRLTYFGLRKSEVLGVKLGSLKLVGTRFKILLDESRTSYRPNGKGMKTKNSERYIVVDEETTQLLKFAIKFSRKLAKESGRILSKNSFLFLDTGKKLKKHGATSCLFTNLWFV